MDMNNNIDNISTSIGAMTELLSLFYRTLIDNKLDEETARYLTGSMLTVILMKSSRGDNDEN